MQTSNTTSGTFKNELGETLLNVKITIIAQLDDSVVRQISGPSVSCGVMYNSVMKLSKHSLGLHASAIFAIIVDL